MGKKYFPGLRLGDGSIVERVYRAERRMAWVYADNDTDSKPERRLLLRIRMDVRRPDGSMSPDKWYVVKSPVGCEWFVGVWDGKTVIDWTDANRELPKSPCADCNAPTTRWDHIAREPVCWDCCDKKKRKKQDREQYARARHP